MHKLQTNQVGVKMNKTISLLLIFFACSYLYYHYRNDKPFRCDAELISKIELDNSNVEINVYASNVISWSDENSISLTGSIKVDDKEYIVSRMVFFTLQKSKLDGLYKTKIISEEKIKNDNVPDSLWQKYFLSTPIDIYFNSEIIKLNKNAIFLKELSNPIFVCTKIE